MFALVRVGELLKPRETSTTCSKDVKTLRGVCVNEYPLPDPKEEPLKCLVLAYKVTKGIPYDDRTWDAVHFGRVAKSAKQLLEICGSVRVADSCLVEISKRFEDAGLDWRLETIVKHAHDWLARKRGANGNVHRARFFEDLAKRGRSNADNGGFTEGREVLDSLRSLTNPPAGSQKDGHGS